LKGGRVVSEVFLGADTGARNDLKQERIKAKSPFIAVIAKWFAIISKKSEKEERKLVFRLNLFPLDKQ